MWIRLVFSGPVSDTYYIPLCEQQVVSNENNAQSDTAVVTSPITGMYMCACAMCEHI